jgi:hypothetical protein
MKERVEESKYEGDGNERWERNRVGMKQTFFLPVRALPVACQNRAVVFLRNKASNGFAFYR